MKEWDLEKRESFEHCYKFRFCIMNMEVDRGRIRRRGKAAHFSEERRGANSRLQTGPLYVEQ